MSDDFYLKSEPAAFQKALNLHAPLIIVTWIFVIIVTLLAFALGAKPQEFLAVLLFPQSYTVYFLCFPLLVFVLFVISALGDFNKASTVQNIFSMAGSVLLRVDQRFSLYLRSEHFWNSIFALAAMLPLSLFFCIAKSLIPHLTDYSWDPLFSEIDLWLHGGFFPHEPVVALIEKYNLQGLPDLIYFLFFLVMLAAKGYCVFFDINPQRRMCYLWASFLTWVVCGFLLALAMASVGPIFYHEFYEGTSPYKEFYTYLLQSGRDHGLHTVELSKYLIEWVRNESIIDINAISAMPSLHVGAMMLTTLYFWSLSKLLGGVGFIFTLLTLASAVYLGLHYAIDGYFVIPVVILIWWVSNKISFWNLHGFNRTAVLPSP